jgi:hypothetical protein
LLRNFLDPALVATEDFRVSALSEHDGDAALNWRNIPISLIDAGRPILNERKRLLTTTSFPDTFGGWRSG